MTRKYTKKSEHWNVKSELALKAIGHESDIKTQKEKASLIKALREAVGMSQPELGKEIGKSKDGVYRLETAQARITPELEDKITKAIAERIELSYIAGLIDRRCVFTIYNAKPKSYNCRTQEGFEVRIIFNTKHKILVELMQKVLKAGKVMPRKSSYKNEDCIGWCFQAFTKDAEVVLDKLLPYLKIKKPLAEILLDLRELQNSEVGRAKSGNEEYIAQQRALYDKFMAKKALISNG